jgi:hypothetical protein
MTSKEDRMEILKFSFWSRRLRLMEFSEKKAWGPYLAGALGGVFSILSVWIISLV